MVLDVSYSRVLGQRPTFYCPLVFLRKTGNSPHAIRRNRLRCFHVWFVSDRWQWVAPRFGRVCTGSLLVATKMRNRLLVKMISNRPRCCFWVWWAHLTRSSSQQQHAVRTITFFSHCWSYMTGVLSLTQMLVKISIFACDVEHTCFHFGLCGRTFVLCLFGQCQVHHYVIAGSTQELYTCLIKQMTRLLLKISRSHYGYKLYFVIFWTNQSVCATDYIICSMSFNIYSQTYLAWLCVANVLKIARRMLSGFFATTTLSITLQLSPFPH